MPAATRASNSSSTTPVMVGMSSRVASSIGTQVSSTSSRNPGPTNAFDRMGDRRCIGGQETRIVTPRTPRWCNSTGDEMDLAKVGMHVGFGKLGPDFSWHLRWVIALRAKQKPGFLGGLAHRGERKGACKIHTWLRDPYHQFSERVGVQFADRSHLTIERLDASAGKDKLSGHEFVASVSSAEQYFWFGSGAVNQHQGRRVAWFTVGK